MPNYARGCRAWHRQIHFPLPNGEEPQGDEDRAKKYEIFQSFTSA